MDRDKLHSDIKNIIVECVELSHENNWTNVQVEFRAIYDAFRILNRMDVRNGECPDEIAALHLHNVSGSESSSIRIFKLECLTEDGDMETNGYYRTREASELKKAELDKYPMNLKYGIKQQIVEIDLED